MIYLELSVNYIVEAFNTSILSLFKPLLYILKYLT